MDGFCINTDGGVECECPQDWVLAEDGSRCLDTRKEACFDYHRYDNTKYKYRAFNSHQFNKSMFKS